MFPRSEPSLRVMGRSAQAKWADDTTGQPIGASDMSVKEDNRRFVKLAFLVSLVAICVIINACATQPIPTEGGEVPGFWMGLAHGFTVFFSLISEPFMHHRIYAFPNSGGLYDLGFVLGAGGLFGGGGAIR